ncbi:MAG: class I SAM-dependent methyltransferase [Sedimentisphaerales bacterium]|nr:class I SAM-dependent methyltransferase [Sedimentisphaerales bacterium]
MHTRIEPDCPFGYDRYAFAWYHVPADASAHLDFGCGDGRFLAALESKSSARLAGVDVSREAVTQAEKACGRAQIVHLDATTPLPFADAEFSSASLLDVLEHVHEQDELLGELWRVLSDGGTLIVTVPGRHVFSFLDLGNFKFRFPRLHRWCYCRKHSLQEYEQRYAANPDGLIGDVSARKRWHEHFSRKRLARLLNQNGFSVVEFDGAGLFLRLLKIAELPFRWLGPAHGVVRKVMACDARLFSSANLFCVARKESTR